MRTTTFVFVSVPTSQGRHTTYVNVDKIATITDHGPDGVHIRLDGGSVVVTSAQVTDILTSIENVLAGEVS